MINETWFFREMGPLEAWREAILPELAKNGRPVRMWCAACSMGLQRMGSASTMLGLRFA